MSTIDVLEKAMAPLAAYFDNYSPASKPANQRDAARAAIPLVETAIAELRREREEMRALLAEARRSPWLAKTVLFADDWDLLARIDAALSPAPEQSGAEAASEARKGG